MKKITVQLLAALIIYGISGNVYGGVSMKWKTGTAFSEAGKSFSAAVEFKKKLWIIGGYDYSANSTSADIFSSENGQVWRKISDVLPALYQHTAVEYDNKLWVLGGTGTGGLSNKVYCSKDGLKWEFSSSAIPKITRHASVSFDGKLWIIGGETEQGYTNGVWCFDGKEWQQVDNGNLWPPRSGHKVVCFGDKMWLIGGKDANNYFNDVWSSKNGIAWECVSANNPTPWEGRFDHSLLVKDNKIWLMGGKKYHKEKRTWYVTTRKTVKGVVSCNVEWIGEWYAYKWKCTYKNVSYGTTFDDYPKLDIWVENDRVATDFLRSNLNINKRKDGFSSSVGPSSLIILLPLANLSYSAEGTYQVENSVNINVPDYFNDSWYSPDGITWEQVPFTDIPYEKRCGFVGISFDNKILLIGGEKSNVTNDAVGVWGEHTTGFNDLYYTNNKPVLSWSGDDKFKNTGVNSSEGSHIEFRIKYSDLDNDVPANEYPKAVVSKNGQVISTTILTPSTTSNDYISGVTFSGWTLLQPATYYTFSFETADFYDSTVLYDNPPNPNKIVVKNSNATNILNGNILLEWAVDNTEFIKNFKVYLGETQGSMNEVYSGTDNSCSLSLPKKGTQYYWKVEAIDSYGASTFSDIYTFSTLKGIDKAYNYPNPFNPAKNETTNIVFNMIGNGSAEIKIYTEMGDLCRQERFENLKEGVNQVPYDGKDDNGNLLYNGTYICKITKKSGVGGSSERCRLLIVK